MRRCIPGECGWRQRCATRTHTHTWWDCFCVRGATSLPQPALSAWLSPKCCHPCKHRAKLSPVQTNGVAQPLACSNRPPELSEHEWLLVFDSLCDVWGASCKFWRSKNAIVFSARHHMVLQLGSDSAPACWAMIIAEWGRREERCWEPLLSEVVRAFPMGI